MPKQPGVILDAATVKKFLYACSVVLLLGLALLIFYERHSPFWVKTVSHQPEVYTELYFTHPDRLPASAIAGQSLKLNFAIHNAEARTMLYDYTVSVTAPSGQKTLLSQQQLRLLNGATRAIFATVIVPPAIGRSEISITLLHLPETIHDWIEIGS